MPLSVLERRFGCDSVLMGDFLTINGHAVSLSEAMCWSAVEDSPSIFEATRDRALVRQYAREKDLQIGGLELLEMMDKIRGELGLESAAHTSAWLETNRFSFADFQSACANLILQEKVWRSFSDDDIAAYYADYRDDLARVTLYGARLRDKPSADDIAKRVRSQEADFHLETMAHSIDDDTAPKAGYLGRLTRAELPEELGLSAFSVDPGDLIGPIKLDDGFGLFLVTAIDHPTCEAAADEIRNRLFDQLLEQLVERAIVTVEEKGE